MFAEWFLGQLTLNNIQFSEFYNYMTKVKIKKNNFYNLLIKWLVTLIKVNIYISVEWNDGIFSVLTLTYLIIIKEGE